ncbi:hypothetical protein ACR9E3_07170 [Actinomycetospora sp. C-140]
MGNLIGFALVALVFVVLGAGVVSHARGTSGAASRAGRAAVEVESLFSPAKRHQLEQQEIVDTTRVDQSNGDGNPLDRYTDAAALRRRWNRDGD